MKRKFLICSVLAILMLVTISYASVISANDTVERKESPLYKIRTIKAIGERLEDIREIIKSRFIEDKIFFLPFQFLKKEINENSGFTLLAPSCYYTSGCVTLCGKVCMS